MSNKMSEKDYIYNSGRRDALNAVSSVIETAIKRNDGATTALQIINVFNEITAHVHMHSLELNRLVRSEDVKNAENVENNDLLSVIKSLNMELGEFFQALAPTPKGVM